jgi:hypothetical protein
MSSFSTASRQVKDSRPTSRLAQTCVRNAERSAIEPHIYSIPRAKSRRPQEEEERGKAEPTHLTNDLLPTIDREADPSSTCSLSSYIFASFTLERSRVSASTSEPSENGLNPGHGGRVDLGRSKDERPEEVTGLGGGGR